SSGRRRTDPDQGAARVAIVRTIGAHVPPLATVAFMAPPLTLHRDLGAPFEGLVRVPRSSRTDPHRARSLALPPASPGLARAWQGSARRPSQPQEAPASGRRATGP